MCNYTHKVRTRKIFVYLCVLLTPPGIKPCIRQLAGFLAPQNGANAACPLPIKSETYVEVLNNVQTRVAIDRAPNDPRREFLAICSESGQTFQGPLHLAQSFSRALLFPGCNSIATCKFSMRRADGKRCSDRFSSRPVIVYDEYPQRTARRFSRKRTSRPAGGVR